MSRVDESRLIRQSDGWPFIVRADRRTRQLPSKWDYFQNFIIFTSVVDERNVVDIRKVANRSKTMNHWWKNKKLWLTRMNEKVSRVMHVAPVTITFFYAWEHVPTLPRVNSRWPTEAGVKIHVAGIPGVVNFARVFHLLIRKGSSELYDRVESIDDRMNPNFGFIVN